MDEPTGRQLVLPLPQPAPAEPAPRTGRARRSRGAAPRQLWLFAPYAQVGLPLGPDAPPDRTLTDPPASTTPAEPPAADHPPRDPATAPRALSAPPAGGMTSDMLPLDDPRRPLLELLAAHPCADEAEAADVHRIAAFVAAHPDCFGKANPVAHITASAFVLDPAGRVLLTHHKKLARWLQLGGHSDPHEHDPAATALREATEESGLADLRFHPATGRRPIDVDAHRIPARKAEAAHDHLDLRYALCTDDPAAITLTDESHALRWFTPAEMAELDVDPAFRRALAKVVALGRP